MLQIAQMALAHLDHPTQRISGIGNIMSLASNNALLKNEIPLVWVSIELPMALLQIILIKHNACSKPLHVLPCFPAASLTSTLKCANIWKRLKIVVGIQAKVSAEEKPWALA